MAAAEPSRPSAAASPLLRVDALSVSLVLTEFDGTRYEILPTEPVTARATPVLPVWDAWLARGVLAVRARGQAAAPFEAQLDLAGVRAGPVTAPRMDPTTLDFDLELLAPLAELGTLPRELAKLSLVLSPGLRALNVTRVRLLRLKGSAPRLVNFDVRDATDSLLFDAPERKLFDLRNPEEGFWLGTGRWRLRVAGEWTGAKDPGDKDAPGWTLDLKPRAVAHEYAVAGDASDVLWEDPARRDGDRVSYTEFFLDTSHRALRGRVPPAGMDLPIALTFDHALRYGEHAARAIVRREFAVRLRDPSPLLGGFKRLSAVGIDFGTTATVAAFTHRGFRSLMRLGSPRDGGTPAENPTYLLIDDHEKLWREMAAPSPPAPESLRRFPDVLGAVQASHSAKDRVADYPNAVLGEIKSLPERVIHLDQSPQLRDRTKQSDFILDEPRVRILVRTYAYLLGRAINRPGQDVYLQYWLTYPAEFDERSRALLEEEIRAGLIQSVPEGIPVSEVRVQMCATEPEAYAAEVCPELVNHPAIEALVATHGELRFAVFDFGGGTLDIACGRYRPATEAEQLASGCSSVIETLQVAGNDHLGGDYLTHELAWLTHQYEAHLPEMEAKEVPMARPQTIPDNKLARKPQLYKRSLAGRQNKIRFQRELHLEELKYKRGNQVPVVDKLAAARVDASEVQLESLKSDLPGLHKRLSLHLEERIEDGARLLASMLGSTPWGGKGSWREQGVLVLLAGNSSRGEYVETALAKVLGIPNLRAWRPDGETELQGVVLYETEARVERGAEILGVTPKTAVALGALKIANREVHLVRAAQGFSYFVGDMKGFPPKFVALVPMGTAPANPDEWGPHYADFGTWDAQKPLRVCTEYEPGKMTSSDPRLLTIPTGLPPGSSGRLYACATSPTKLSLHLASPEPDKFVRVELNLAPYLG
jgi:hypothetical protein